MIEYKNGRFRSYRPKEEKSALLKKQIEELPAKQRAALNILIKEAILKKQNSVANVAEKLEWDPDTGPAVPIRQWVNDKYYLGELADSIFPMLKEDMIELFEGDYYECILCLHPDTRIPLLDGTTPKISELAERWKTQPTPFWVYSYEGGDYIPAQAVEPRQTGVDDYFRVTLDDGSTFTGNARHQMVMCDGTKRMIRDMRPGDSIMPFNTRRSSVEDGDDLNGYEKLRLLSGDWIYTHRWVAKAHCHKPSTRHSVVHHADLNKLNNVPSNLNWMMWEAHRDSHLQLAHVERRGDITLDAIKACGAHSLREAAELLSCSCSRIRRVLRNHGYDQIEVFGDRRGRRRGNSDLTLESIKKAIADGARSGAEVAKMIRRGKGTIYRFLKEQGITWDDVKITSDRPTWKITVDHIKQSIADGSRTRRAVAHRLKCDEGTLWRVLNRAKLEWADLKLTPNNHYVTKIEPAGRGPVYCMTVPSAGNFAICTSEVGKEVFSPSERSGVMSSNTGSTRWG